MGLMCVARLGSVRVFNVGVNTLSWWEYAHLHPHGANTLKPPGPVLQPGGVW